MADQVEDDGGSSTLASLLRAARRARLEATERGKVLVSTSGNGHSSTFEMPDDFTAVDAVELVEEISRRYDEALAYLIQEGDPTPTDAELAAEMLDKLHAVRSVACNFEGLRDTREEEE